MGCDKQNKMKVFMEQYMSAPLKPYQIKTLYVTLCNKCNITSCRNRLANKQTLDHLIIPRHSTRGYRQVLEYAEAYMRTAPDNVLK